MQSLSESGAARQSVTGSPSRISVTQRSLARPSRTSTSSPPMFRKKSSAEGPSLMGLLASKRFAKRMSSRYGANRRSSGSKSHPSRLEQRLEPTYRMDPKHKFQDKKVINCIEEVLQPRLKTFHYSAKAGALMGRVISEEVKQSVKALCFDRYKLIVSVVIGEKKGQGVNCSSRCAWDEKRDSYATYTMEGQDYFCTVNVFGIYTE